MGKVIPFAVRFWAKVERRGPDECWPWRGNRHTNGYGRISITGREVATYAHRASWTIHFGEIPVGLFVCHHCDNPGCVNPKHLFLGTPLDNVRDRNAKGRQYRGLPLSVSTRRRVWLRDKVIPITYGFWD